ncbi:hypothetical protein ACFQ05_28950 [Amycolatopsis umgeniensis]|uniref:CRP-like cAMP-binding protein n=1 Tax=Amycolatopsis umgeniensis TaxID=336628 RepID=A0A841BA92_9PSEU|nr:hypothetical protein [Amycolatopsis umgeniensis]MBB5856926.1 CRP-like cAMP-binding protein [Amycolatopsis umgeniensis]
MEEMSAFVARDRARMSGAMRQAANATVAATRHQNDLIHEAAAMGMSQRQIAQDNNTNQATVSRILARRARASDPTT